jgi:hypothetical protein
VIGASLDTCWCISRDQGRMVLIPNTLEISSFWVSPPLLDEVKGQPELTVETDFQPIPFDSHGDLLQEELFPESQRARRPRE